MNGSPFFDAFFARNQGTGQLGISKGHVGIFLEKMGIQIEL